MTNVSFGGEAGRKIASDIANPTGATHITVLTSVGNAVVTIAKILVRMVGGPPR
jgi:hypothetical protein